MSRFEPGCAIVYLPDAVGGSEKKLGQVAEVDGEYIKLAYEGLWVHISRVMTEGVVGDD